MYGKHPGKAGGIALPFKDKDAALVILGAAPELEPGQSRYKVEVVYEAVDSDLGRLFEIAVSHQKGEEAPFFGPAKDEIFQSILREFNTEQDARRRATLGVSYSPNSENPNNFPFYQAILTKYLPRDNVPLLVIPDPSLVVGPAVRVELGRFSDVKEVPALAALCYGLCFLDGCQPVYAQREAEMRRYTKCEGLDDDPLAY